MTNLSPRARALLGYVDTDGDGVTDTPPSGGDGGSIDLSGYAKKTELAPKADKIYVDTELGKKANASSLASKAEKTYVDTELAKKATPAYVDSKVAEASTGGSVDLSAYAKKTDLAEKASTVEVNALRMNQEADSAYWEQELGKKADKTYTDGELAKKANASSLASKAEKSYVDAELAKKADKTALSTPTVTGVAVENGALKLTYSNGFIDTIPLPAGNATAPESTEPKIVPLSLSAGQQDSLATGKAQTGRKLVLPMKWGAPVTRFKIHMQNINPRTGTTGSDVPVNITAVGENNAGTLVAPQSLSISGTVKGSTDFATDWIDYPLSTGKEYGIEMDYTGTANAKILINAGGSWVTNTPTDIWAWNGVPFHIWIEAETPASTTVYTFAGDSLTAGIGSALPVFDSWPYQLSRIQGVLPVMYAASGDVFDTWTDGSVPYKVNLWDDARFSKGDVLFQNMGSNNVFYGNSLDAMKSKAKAFTALMRGKVVRGAPVVTTSILPRNSQPATDSKEVVRKDYNTWLATKPADIGNVKHIDFISAVSADNDNLPTELTSDGTHLTTAGYTKLAESANTQWSKSESVPATFTG